MIGPPLSAYSPCVCWLTHTHTCVQNTHPVYCITDHRHWPIYAQSLYYYYTSIANYNVFTITPHYCLSTFVFTLCHPQTRPRFVIGCRCTCILHTFCTSRQSTFTLRRFYSFVQPVKSCVIVNAFENCRRKGESYTYHSPDFSATCSKRFPIKGITRFSHERAAVSQTHYTVSDTQPVVAKPE
jgi:phage terminase large subunit-like protein